MQIPVFVARRQTAKRANAHVGTTVTEFANTATTADTTTHPHAELSSRLGNAAEAPTVRTSTSTSTTRPPRLSRLPDSVATLRTGKPRAKVVAKPKTKLSNPRALNAVVAPSHRDAVERVTDLSLALPPGLQSRGGADKGPDIGQRVP